MQFSSRISVSSCRMSQLALSKATYTYYLIKHIFKVAINCKTADLLLVQHFQQLDPHSPPPDVDPGTLEKRREKVTKLSWEESELAKRSLHRSRAAH